LKFPRCLAAALAAASISWGLVACGGDDSAPSGTTVTTLSNRADLISGGSALVEVKLPASVRRPACGITFTAGQQAWLNAVFPTGVCDWSQPGVGQQDAIGPLTYTAGPGGVPLPTAPTSTSL
jgi:uncharacterized tannase-like protein DUF6351